MSKKKIGLALIVLAIVAAVYFFVIKKRPDTTQEDKDINRMPSSSPADEAAYQAMKDEFFTRTGGKDWNWLVKTVKERVQNPALIPSVYAPFDGFVKTTALYSVLAQAWIPFSAGGPKAGEVGGGGYKYAPGYDYQTTSDKLYFAWSDGRTAATYAGF